MARINLSNTITTPVLEDNGLPLCWLVQALDCISLAHLFTFGGDEFPYLSKFELIENVTSRGWCLDQGLSAGAVFEYMVKKGVFEAFAHPWDERLVVDTYSQPKEENEEVVKHPLPKRGMKYRLSDADWMYVTEEENAVYEESLLGVKEGVVLHLENDRPVVVAIPVDSTFQGRRRNMDPYKGPPPSTRFTAEEDENIESHSLIVTGVDDRDPGNELFHVKNCYGSSFANDGYDIISANIITCFEAPLLDRNAHPWIKVLEEEEAANDN